MEQCIKEWKELLRANKKHHIAFVEPLDLRVLHAASNLAKDALLTPVLIGDKTKVTAFATEHRICIKDCILKEQDKEVEDVNEYGTLLLQNKVVDGFITGATYSTRDVIRPALQHIPLKRKNGRICGVMAVATENRTMLFADCSIHIEPSANELVSIATEAIETAIQLAIEPRVAFVSYTSHSKRTDETAQRIRKAVKLTKIAYPHIPIDGELQFDAAFTPDVAIRKIGNSEVDGNATIFIFPTLEAGNIACKIIEHLTTAHILGPMTQGFTLPIHDLSRGCTTKTIYDLAIYAAVQALKQT